MDEFIDEGTNVFVQVLHSVGCQVAHAMAVPAARLGAIQLC